MGTTIPMMNTAPLLLAVGSTCTVVAVVSFTVEFYRYAVSCGGFWNFQDNII